MGRKRISKKWKNFRYSGPGTGALGRPFDGVFFSGPYDNAAFLQGYGQKPTLPPHEGVRRTLYNLYLYLVMLIEYAFRDYESQSQRIWAERKARKELKRLKAL